MNIQGGGLSFEISGSNDKLLSVLNESKKAIQNFSTAAISGEKDIEPLRIQLPLLKKALQTLTGL